MHVKLIVHVLYRYCSLLGVSEMSRLKGGQTFQVQVVRVRAISNEYLFGGVRKRHGIFNLGAGQS